MSSGGTNPAMIFIFCSCAANGFFGNVQTCQRQLHGICQLGGIVTFSAADIQNFSFCTEFPGSGNQSLRNGGIVTRLQKSTAGQHLLPGIAGGEGMFLLYCQQIHIALAGNIKAVAMGADKGSVLLNQHIPTDGTQKFHLTYPLFLKVYHTPFSPFRQMKENKKDVILCGGGSAVC